MKESRDEILLKTEEYLILPASYLQLPGLHAFGYAKFNEANTPLEDHYHPGCMEFTVMLGGSQTYEVSGKKYTLLPGDVFTNLAGEIHGTGDEPQGISEFCFLEIDVRKKSGFLGLTAPWDQWMYAAVTGWNQRLVQIPESCLELAQKAFRCFSTLVEEPDNIRMRLQGQSLILAFFNQLVSSGAGTRQLARETQEAMDYIGLHVAEQLEPEQIAAAVGVSSATLKRRFKEDMGMSIRDYVTRRKLQQSRVMLQDNAMSMTEISYALGFSDSSYFSAVFRQYMGCAPREYRRQRIRQQMVG